MMTTITTTKRTIFVWACIALYTALLLAALLTSGCGTVKSLTDPQTRVSRILRKHPELVGKLFPTDTVYQRHDSTVYIPGSSDTVTISQMLLDTLTLNHVTVLKDSASGIIAEMWRDAARQLHLAITKQPDSLKIEWREKLVTRTFTQTVDVLPEWAKIALWVASALIVACLFYIFVQIRRNRP